MIQTNYLRYAKNVQPVTGKKVKKVTVSFKVNDVEASIKVTDFMLQSGRANTGYTIHTQEMLKRTRDTSDNIIAPRFYNGIIRGKATIIINNKGTASTGLDLQITPVKNTTGNISVSTFYDTRKTLIKEILTGGDNLTINSSDHTIEHNGTQLADDKYSGAPMLSPSGWGMYKVEMNNRDSACILATVTQMDSRGKY